MTNTKNTYHVYLIVNQKYKRLFSSSSREKAYSYQNSYKLNPTQTIITTLIQQGKYGHSQCAGQDFIDNLKEINKLSV